MGTIAEVRYNSDRVPEKEKPPRVRWGGEEGED
jgi:hypothetical protein